VVPIAKEAWTVFYEVEDAGAQSPFNWKEKDIVTKNGEKNSGLFAANQLVSIKETVAGATQLNTTLNGRTFTKSQLITNEPQLARFITIEAEGAEEACEAVRLFIGQASVEQKFLACATANLTEANPIP
jgi:hypothetical protein